MKLDDKTFEKHGILYLSPSSIRKYRLNPAKWLVNIAGYRDRIFSPSMSFGIAVEQGITKGVMEDAPINECVDYALSTYDDIYKDIDDNGARYDYKKCLEKQVIIGEVLDEVIPKFKRFGKPTAAQMWVEIYLDLPIPFKGIVDLLYDDYVRDIKTTGIMPKGIKKDHQHQLSIYSMATSKDPFVDVVYVTKNKRELHTMPIQNVSENVKEIRRIAMKMWQMLSFSSDIHEVCAMSCLEPDISNENFMNQWGPTEIEGAKTLFNLKD